MILTTSYAQDCVPEHNSCSFYLCLEKQLKCGTKGYPISYGYKFCHNFLNVNMKTEKGKQWLMDTRLCLQQRVIESKQTNCQDLWEDSIRDHVNCYIETGYCDLSSKEKTKVKYLVLKEFFSYPGIIYKNIRAFQKIGCR